MPDETPHLREERSAAPGISPGVVRDSEYVLRELYFPYDAQDQAGEVLTERAIAVKDLQRRGVSLHRMNYAGAACVKRAIEQTLGKERKDEPWTSLGVAKLHTGEVRALRLPDDAETQVLVVIDTAMVEQSWHASIYAKQQDASRSKCRELRDLLLPLLKNNLVSVDEAYSGQGFGQPKTLFFRARVWMRWKLSAFISRLRR